MAENLEFGSKIGRETLASVQKDHELTHRKIQTKLRKGVGKTGDRFDGWIEANTITVADETIRTPRWYPGPAGAVVEYMKVSYEGVPDFTVTIYKNGVSVWSEAMPTGYVPYELRTSIGLGPLDYIYIAFTGTASYPSAQLGWYYGYESSTDYEVPA